MRSEAPIEDQECNELPHIMIVENSFIGMLLPFEYSSSRPWKADKLALYSIAFRREDDVLAEVSR